MSFNKYFYSAFEMKVKIIQSFVAKMLSGQMYYYLLITIMLLLIFHYKNYFRAVYLALSLAGPTPLPLLGNIFLIKDSKKLVDLSVVMYKLYGPIMRCWITILPFFFVLEPKDIQLILGNSKVSNKNFFYSFMHNFVGEGLITSDNEKWRQHRKFIQPYFHLSILKGFTGIFKENSALLVEKFNQQSNATVNVTSFINDCVLNILHEAVLGLSSRETRSSPFRKGEVLVTYRLTRPWLLLNSIFKFTQSARKEFLQKANLQNYVRQIVEERHNKTGNINLMDMLLDISEKNPEFTINDVINESCTFMLAGQDSVGAAIAFSLHFLAKHQQIQQEVVRELGEIWEKSGNDITFDDLTKLTYLEQCIKEAMRLCPSVPIISRKLTENVIIGKRSFPAGTNFFLSPFVTHRLDHIFPDPLQFDPGRFTAENQQKMHAFAYLPFSAGPRNCIGYKFALLEMKMILAHIVHHFHLELVLGREELNLSYRITLRVKGGVWLKLTKRL